MLVNITKLGVNKDILLWIISGIGKNARIQPPLYSISACQYKSMFICIDKFTIKEFCPLSVKEFSMTMRKQRITG